MEQVFSGYCRVIDGARVVLCEWDAGERDIGCDFEVCPHAGECPVGRQIAAWMKEEERA